MIDPFLLTQKLIRCPSVTPKEGGALLLLKEVLEGLGFECFLKVFSSPETDPVSNLYAARGKGPFHFCFAGHTDVVPVGEEKTWSHDPFGGEIHHGWLYGRGAVDMKGAIGAYVSALSKILSRWPADWEEKVRLSLLITGDEEGPAVHGTVPMLQWLQEREEKLSFCLIGEPTSQESVGDCVKIGRRGSFHAFIKSVGKQGHVAYPEKAHNPIPALVSFLADVCGTSLDKGTDLFPPSSLQITTVDVGNPTHNMIPAEGHAHLNIRYNPHHTAQSLESWLKKKAAPYGLLLETHGSGNAFVSQPHPLHEIIQEKIQEIVGKKPAVTTGGGTSDGRFISQFCPVLELGLCHETAHQVDERVSLEELDLLTQIYEKILESLV